MVLITMLGQVHLSDAQMMGMLWFSLRVIGQQLLYLMVINLSKGISSLHRLLSVGQWHMIWSQLVEMEIISLLVNYPIHKAGSITEVMAVSIIFFWNLFHIQAAIHNSYIFLH